MNSSICEGFAKALFSLTKKEDLLNVNKALDEVKKQMDENKDFSSFLFYHLLHIMAMRNLTKLLMSFIIYPMKNWG